LKLLKPPHQAALRITLIQDETIKVLISQLLVVTIEPEKFSFLGM
jgi:hypothetical protein